MNLRPYQIDTLNRVRSGWAEFNRQLVVWPTGAGKTILAAHLSREHVDSRKRVLFLAHREELLLQTLDKFKRAAGLVGDLEKAEYRASRMSDVVVGSVQTFMARGYDWAADHFDLVIVDEAHHVLAKSYRNVLDMFPEARVLGITATPDRGDKKNLGAFFENIAAEVGLFDLIRDGYLSPIVLKAVPLSIELTNVRQTAGDFNEADLGEALDPYLEQIAAAIKQHASFRRVLCFVPLIATSHKFVEICKQQGIVAEHIDGQSPDRRQILERFARGEFDLLSNAMLLTEGFDDPGIDCVVVLRPTRSRPLYSQMVGRGTRVTESKENLLLLDFLWHHERHSLVRPAHLIAKNDEEADQITRIAEDQPAGGEVEQELDLDGLATSAQQEREAKLRRELAEHKHKNLKVISAEDFAIEHGSIEAAEFEPVMQWEMAPVTEKQAWLLERNKIDLKTVRGRGHASKLIGLIKSQERVMLASSAQRWKMKQMGYEHAESATVAEARQFFSKVRKPA